MSHIKALATKEPLVDIVNPEQVVTNYDQILDINTETCTKEDLTFTVPFKLVSRVVRSSEGVRWGRACSHCAVQ
jgi:protein arginine N-methyltransferase 1